MNRYIYMLLLCLVMHGSIHASNKPTTTVSSSQAKPIKLDAATEQLFKGVRSGDLEMVQKSLAAGAQVNAKDEKYYRPLLDAINGATMGENRATYKLIIAALLNAKADVNITDRSGMFPLLSASYSYDPEIVKMLLDAGADVNKRHYYDDNTALLAAVIAAGKSHSSTLMHHYEIIKLLLSAGANPYIEDEDFFYVAKSTNPVLVKIINEWERSQSPARIAALKKEGQLPEGAREKALSIEARRMELPRRAIEAHLGQARLKQEGGEARQLASEITKYLP